MKRPALAGVVSTFLVASLFAAAPASASETCGGYLTNMTDPLALRMEAGETVIWDNVTADLIQKRNQYVSLLKQKGWTIEYTSAYRPIQYQRHLYEIVQYASQSSCVAQEKAKHGLGTDVAAPNANAPHTKGIAFDAIVRNSSGTALNGKTFVNSALRDVAAQAGLTLPLPTTDGVHHTIGSGGTDGILQVGDQGTAVKTVQQQLNLVGYTLTADGIFGTGTESIVQQFQAAHGLTADGIVGPSTSSKLSSLATTTTTLKLGSSGDAVKVLQRLLTKKGYSVTADGAFGSGTESTVKRFQSANGLTADGIVGSATWSKLRS